ncbi:short-chain dehydrogenase/reductase SDR [Planoprotostelium fungivorum]|uniref:Short-chain dehydrogenase/reductase SDR n=1 Tax=Planoprotostelium fungivorum TaxID=1890364 RepID=A0A2P6MWI8_9EUKA|nr:short-chain dehydrogenase/reductase SDR [Planoprotostelium fungivorum]
MQLSQQFIYFIRVILEIISLAIDAFDIVFYSAFSAILGISARRTVEPSTSALIITGASSGIGRYLALRFAQRGYTVYSTVRNEKDAISLREEWMNIGGRGEIVVVLLDVTDENQMQQVHTFIREDIYQRGVKLQGLINNAGTFATVVTAVANHRHQQEVFHVNYFAVLRLCQTFLPLLSLHSGRIINIGSGSAYFPMKLYGLYAGSKAALRATTETLGLECAAVGVSVSLVEPGAIETRMTRAWDDDVPMETDPNSHVIEGEAVETYQALSEMCSAQRRQIKRLANIFCASPRMLMYPIIHALEGRYPLSHYYPGVDAKAARLGRHILTDNMWSILMKKQ